MSSPDPSRRAEATRWPVIGWLSAAGLLAAFQLGKMPAALPSIRADLAMSLVAAGWAVSMINVTTMSLGTPAGVASDRLGHRRVLLASLGLIAASSVLGGLAPVGDVLVLSRLLEGVAFLGLVVSIPSFMVAATAPPDRGFVLASWSARVPLGMALMIVATPLTIAMIGWRGLWYVNAAFALVVLIGLARVTRDGIGRGAPARRWWPDLKAALTLPGPWLLAACFIAYAAMWMAVMIWLPTFLVERRGWSLNAAAWGTALVVVANVPSNLMCGRIVARGTPIWLLIALPSLAMGGFGYGIFEPAVPDSVKLLLAVAFSFFGGFLPGSIMVAVPRHAPSPEQVGAVNGVIVQGSNLGHLAGPPVLAALVSWSGGWDNSGGLLLGAGVVGAGLALLVRRVEG